MFKCWSCFKTKYYFYELLLSSTSIVNALCPETLSIIAKDVIQSLLATMLLSASSDGKHGTQLLTYMPPYFETSLLAAQYATEAQACC